MAGQLRQLAGRPRTSASRRRRGGSFMARERPCVPKSNISIRVAWPPSRRRRRRRRRQGLSAGWPACCPALGWGLRWQHNGARRLFSPAPDCVCDPIFGAADCCNRRNSRSRSRSWPLFWPLLTHVNMRQPTKAARHLLPQQEPPFVYKTRHWC